MTAQDERSKTKAAAASLGVMTATMAFLIWGLSPLYWKLLKSVPAFEILMHRMVWSFLFLLPLLIIRRRIPEFLNALKNRKIATSLLVTTTIVGFNWFLFIWAINNDHILQTSLGYYITPLVNIFLGMLFLKERLRPVQKAAVILAGLSVLYLTLHAGEFPWVSLTLAFSFGTYGLIRKTLAVSALVGLTVETLLLSFPALAYLVYLDNTGAGAFLQGNFKMDLFLIGSAVVTALPLLLFTMGARLLNLSTVGFLQYIAPSCSFLLAVMVYHEPLSLMRLGAFVLIWTALGMYSVDSIVHHRRLVQTYNSSSKG